MKKSICFVFAMMSLGYGRVDNWELINYNNPGFTGSGVGIGFLDSVFNAQHPSLSGKTSVLGNGVDFGSTSYKDAYDLTHGTHVAAIAAGNAVDSHHGVAPDALIFGVSYLNPKYTFDKSANEIVNFLENSVKVVNNSWGLKYYYFMNKIIGVNNITFLDAYRDLTKAELQEGLNDIGLIANIQLAKKGILQVSSTGNEGQRTSNLNASYRAAYDNSLKAWIAVSAINNYFTTKTGNSFTLEKQQKNFKTDTVSDMNTYGFVGGYNSFSNSFKGIQSYAILAPGFQIESANAYYGQDLNEQWTYDRYICKADEFCPLSGTSQAAPFVSGAAALIAQKYSYVDGGVLADIILSTANANVTLPDLIIKSYKQSSNDTDTYYDVIYTNPNDISKINDKNKVKDDLKNQLGISDDQANYILTHLMNNINDANNNYAVYMSKEELIGQGILDIEKALKGLGKLDANRMTKNDIQAREGGKQAIYKINLNGGVTQFDNDISQEVWDQKWHDTSASTALKGIDKIGLEKTGGGTLILNGNNTYYGDTIVNGGTLKLTGGLTNSSVFAQNSGIFNLAGTASKDVTALNNGIVLLSSGTISGTLYSKNNGIIELQKGANINANSVNNAGILKGIGTINGDIINTGIVKAGFYDEVTDTTDKLGNLEVKGKFTQNTDGILQIAFTKSSETSSEVKNSTLSANSYDIKGSLVYVPLHTTASLIKANDKIQINLDSNNSNSSGSSHSLKDKLNDFTSVTAQSTNLLVFNIDNTDKTKLVAALKVTDGANADITKALQNVMSASHLSGDSKSVIVQLEILNPQDFNDALNSIKDSPSGSNVDTIDTLQKSLGLKNILFSLDPFSGVGGFNTASAIFAPTAAIGDQYLGKIDDIYIKTQTSGGMAYRNTNHNDYKQNMYMLDVQGKRKISDNALLGGFVGLATAKTTKHNSQINSNMFSLGVSYNHDLNVFGLLASASLGMSFNDSNNRILYTFGSDTNANYKHYFANFQVGAYKSFALTRDYRLIPIVMIDYSVIYQDSFKESGALAKSYDSNTIGYARGWLGTNFNHRLEFSNNWQLSTTLFAFYWMRFSDIRINQSLSFIEASDQKFTSSSSGEKQGLYAGIALEVKKANVFFRTSFSDEKTSAYNQFEVMLRGGINF